MLALGTEAPPFQLTDVVAGQTVTLDSFAGKRGLLVMFICRHCPYVRHVQRELARLGEDYANQPLGIVAISSNDATAYGVGFRVAERCTANCLLLISTRRWQDRRLSPQRTDPRRDV